MGASGDGAQDVQITQQGLRGGGLGPHGGPRRVISDAQHEQRIGQHQVAGGARPREVDLIEPPDLPGAEPMRRDRVHEAEAIGGVGARHRHAVLHRGVRDQPSRLHVLLDRIRQRAHQTQASGHPAHAAIEAPCERVEGEVMVVVQGAEQPPLLERAVGRVGAQKLAKDQRLGLRHLPHDGRDGIALQPAEAAHPFVAIHHHVRRAPGHDHDRHLLARVGQRGQQPPFPRRLSHPQPLVPPVELMKFQVHGPSIRWGRLWHRADRVLPAAPGKSTDKSNPVKHFTRLLVLRGSRGKSAGFSRQVNDLRHLLVLRSPEQDSTEMAEEIGAGDSEFLLGEIPRQLRERGREHQRQHRGLGLVGTQPPALDAMRDEVVGITPTPGRLRPYAPRSLTRRGRTGALATADAPVRHKPATADTARTLREHPQMLASSAGTQSGPLLASNPGSILASAEVCG